MGKSEPALIPEWLKSSGSVTGGVSVNHQYTSSSLPSDDHATLRPARNKFALNISDQDLVRTSVSDRTTSSYFRRSSNSNGSSHLRSYGSFGSSHLRSYGSFGRTNHDRDWDKDIYDYRDKEKSVFGNNRHRNYLDPIESILPSRFEKDSLRHTQSTLSGERRDTLPRKVPADLSNDRTNNHNNGNTWLAGSSPIRTVNKASFDRDFPSLGVEERQKTVEIGRVPSPGLNMAIQNLPVGSSALIGDGGWTSALAEVPVVVESNGTSSSSVPPNSASVASILTNGLSMAESLAQGAPRVQDTLQLSVETQRLEELAIKQSRQLIPVTPSMPKTSVLNASEKLKPKVGQQQNRTSTHLINHYPRGTPMKSDISKTSSLGKLQVLKPARDRSGVSYAAKDSSSPTSSSSSSSSKVANNPFAAAPPSAAGSASLRSPVDSPILASAECNPGAATLGPTILEKRPTSQAKSRNDFFNLVRKKSMTNTSSVGSPSVLDKLGENEVINSLIPQGRDSPLVDRSDGAQLSRSMGDLISNGDDCDGPQKSYENGERHTSSDVILYSEEEEAVFLRSLGWDENAGEDGLTEEEISSFYRDASKYINSGLSAKGFQGTNPEFLVPVNLQMGSTAGVLSGVISSDSKLDS